ncbi:hypothetical protein FSP39_011297 [Pinctada imbricata]|uniref:Tyr recombinase domain-containing protein n=1 Tax=Pinctada imbricata TaxID=66713 RepID=A0AA89BM77_PINIB|nr:hypothetical protein FSP39_011297 [Pinctada imbricata]
MYNTGFKQWCKWCNDLGLTALPASDYHVSLYLIALMQSDASSSKLDLCVYSIKWAHELAGMKNPCDTFLVKNVLEGAKRMVSKPTVKKEPITPDILLKLVNKYGLDANLYDKRSITMCLVAYSGFLRFSELINIRACDIEFHDLYVSLFIEKSKTDQYREGNWVLISKINSPACAFTFLKNYLSSAQISLSSDEFIFRQLSFCKSSNDYKLRSSEHLSYTRARELLLEKLNDLDLDISKYGLHSLRSGGATAAANRGVSDRLFKKHGRWRSERAKDGYVKEDISSLLSVSMNLGL